MAVPHGTRIMEAFRLAQNREGARPAKPFGVQNAHLGRRPLHKIRRTGVPRSREGLYLDGEDSWQVAHNGGPGIAGVGGNVDLAAAGAEVDAAGIERVYRHGVAEDVDVAIALREALGERFPLVAAGLAAVDAKFAIGNEVFAVAFDGRD